MTTGNNKDFDPTKIEKVAIDDVEPNDYNPKEKDTPEYRNVVESIRVNGLKQPIFVREVDGNDKYVIVDGEQRYTAAKELGYGEIYVYNLGKISEAEAKSLTIWFEVQVPFMEIELAPLVVELNELNFTLPYTDRQIEDFENLVKFDFNEAYKDEEPIGDEEEIKLKNFTVKMTPEQMEVVQDAIKMVVDGDNVSEGRALELLCASGISQYPFDGTGDIELES